MNTHQDKFQVAYITLTSNLNLLTILSMALRIKAIVQHSHSGNKGETDANSDVKIFRLKVRPHHPKCFSLQGIHLNTCKSSQQNSPGR